MRQNVIAAAVITATSLLGANLALAEDSPFSGNVTFVSDYVSRGYSWSDGRPAIQGSIDFNHASGLYIGMWGSSVAEKSVIEGSSGVELDVYIGYAGEIGAFGFDVGAVRYIYPGSHKSDDTDSTELYLGVSWEFLSLTYYRDIDFDSNYLNFEVAYPLTESLTLDASIGYTDPDDGKSARDWKLGVTQSFVGLDFGLHYVDSNVKNTPNYDKALVLSISKSF